MELEVCIQMNDCDDSKWNCYKKFHSKIDKLIKKYNINIISRDFNDQHYQLTEVCEFDTTHTHLQASIEVTNLLRENNYEQEILYVKSLEDSKFFPQFQLKDIADCMKEIVKLRNDFKEFVSDITESNTYHHTKAHSDIVNIYNILGSTVLPEKKKDFIRTISKVSLTIEKKNKYEIWDTVTNILNEADKIIRQHNVKLISRTFNEDELTLYEVFEYSNPSNFMNVSMDLKTLAHSHNIIVNMIELKEI